MQIYEMVPEGCELSIRSWLEGTDRRYVCTLTDNLAEKGRWTGSACNDLKTALAAARAAVDIPPVDRHFWKGAKSSAFINAALWALIILATMGA